jgi:hypothetical protein
VKAVIFYQPSPKIKPLSINSTDLFRFSMLIIPLEFLLSSSNEILDPKLLLIHNGDVTLMSSSGQSFDCKHVMNKKNIALLKMSMFYTSI